MTNEGANHNDETMDLWHVKMPNGDVRVLTLEQLDDWFQKGFIGEQTLVLEEGSTQWRTLADVAGLGAPEEPAPPAAPLFVAPHAVAPTAAPMAVPTAMSMSIPMSMGSMQSFPVSSPPPPVVSDVNGLDDLDLDYPKPSKKKWVVVAAAAALVVAGLAVAVTKVGGSADSAAAAGAALTSNVSTSVAAPPPPVKVDPPAPVVAAKPQLTDAQRKALLDADKAREARAVKRKGERLTASPSRRAPKSGNPFHKGGSKYDPLNGSL